MRSATKLFGSWTWRAFDGRLAYAEGRRAQVVLSELWAEALRGSKVVVNAMHPGWVDSPSRSPSPPFLQRLAHDFLRTPSEGADTEVWLAASARAREVTGRFFFDREERSTHWVPFTRESEEDRRTLWELCEGLAQGPSR